MTRYYYYIEAGAILDSTSRIYQVAVGTSQQATRDYLYLMAHAVDHNHYFELKSTKSVAFVHLIMTETPLPSSCMLTTSARALVKHFKQSVSIPLNPAALKNHHHFSDFMDLNYRLSNRLSESAKR